MDIVGEPPHHQIGGLDQDDLATFDTPILQVPKIATQIKNRIEPAAQIHQTSPDRRHARYWRQPAERLDLADVTYIDAVALRAEYDYDQVKVLAAGLGRKRAGERLSALHERTLDRGNLGRLLIHDRLVVWLPAPILAQLSNLHPRQ